MSWSASSLVAAAVTSSTRAVQFDHNGHLDAAVFNYRQAASLLQLAVRSGGAVSEDPTKAEAWTLKAQEYLQRADELERTQRKMPEQIAPSQNMKLLQQCHFLFQQGLEADEADQKDEAVQLYTQAVEVGLKASKSSDDEHLKAKIASLARTALDRAEHLKGIDRNAEAANVPSPSTSSDFNQIETRKFTTTPAASSSSNVVHPQLHRGSSAHLKITGQENYTEEEKRVLLQTSNINGINYVPFMKVDLSERFQYTIPFTDKDGLLELSPKQKSQLKDWARPEEICPEPKLVIGTSVDCYSIKQTVVTDCSFVASLAVAALYEKRFGRRLVTSIIYPRNSKREPIYNPFGKYMVKLHLNGIPRKVIIDDHLPMGRGGQLLCSYSTNRSEFWISLLEKAYMKVMGGYDFPGSNSNIDLHALTGWIPERKAINGSDFNPDGLFDLLLTRMSKGDVLVTVATGDLPEIEAERSGLVTSHAYAVLDVRRINNVRLLKLKNPWSHVRWRGNYSELDTPHWTSALREALNYDPASAAMFDNGVFWIDYDSIIHFFEVFYLSWNPAIFKYTYCIHQSWNAGAGPIKDIYNIGENPQFSLTTESPGAVWILLTRHITEIADFKENKEFITVLVYKNNGKRVFYPNDPPPYIDGVRINSPHYLCKLILNEQSAKNYTLVISQYEKMHTIYYTLRAYATCPFTLKKIVTNRFPYVKEISDGQWSGHTAGGCGNHPETYKNNPRYQITLESSSNNNTLMIDLKGPKQYQIGFQVVTVVINDPSAPGAFRKKDSGAFRSGFVILELEDVPTGTYDIIPATFYPNQEGPFFLKVKSSCSFKLNRIQ